jgi:hypothetical protein
MGMETRKANAGFNNFLFAQEWKGHERRGFNTRPTAQKCKRRECLKPPRCTDMKQMWTRQRAWTIPIAKWAPGMKHAHDLVFWARNRVPSTTTHQHRCIFALSMCWAWNHPCWVASVLEKGCQAQIQPPCVVFLCPVPIFELKEIVDMARSDKWSRWREARKVYHVAFAGNDWQFGF